MATVLLWEDGSGRSDFIAFDVVTSENHEATVDITEFPVEQGANLTDHARPVPPLLTLEGYVSLKPLWSNPGVEDLASFRRVDVRQQVSFRGPNQPVPLTYPVEPELSFSLNGLSKALVRAIRPLPRSYDGRAPTRFRDGSTSFNALAFNAFVNRCRVIAEKLEDCRMNARRIRVGTTLRDYVDMLIAREAEPRTAEDGSGINFQIDLKQIRTVRSQTVDAPKPAEARGAARVSTGSKAGAKDPNGEEKKAKLKSTLASGADALFGE